MTAMNIKVGIKGLKNGTNILDIKVPQKLRTRIPTGVEFFDTALGGGGFVPSQVMMLTGTPGAGKTTLLMQLADAITGKGNVCLFNTGEESLYQTAMVRDRLKLKNGFICGQENMVDDLLKHADQLRKQNTNKQVFIIHDSLPTLNDGKYGNLGTTGKTPIRCGEMLTNWAKDNYGIVIFINQVTKSGQFVGKNTIKHMVDTHGELYFDEEKKSETYGERLFTVSKNRFGVSGKTMIVGLDESGLYEKGSIQSFDVRDTSNDDE